MSRLETSDLKLHGLSMGLQAFEQSTDFSLSEVADAAKKSFKCRIPQRQRAPYKPKATSNIKATVVSSQQHRFVARPGSRPRSGEQPDSPKSANRMKDAAVPPKSGASRAERERVQIPQKKTAVIPKRIPHDISSNKSSRPVIMVPVRQNQLTKTLYTNRALTYLPDQETINRHEDLELQQSDLTVENNIDLNDAESITSKKEKITQLKISWQEKSVLFEQLKNDLNEKQKAITQLYASMGATHKQLSALGNNTSLPSLEELQIINVANLSPEQLLQLCANEQTTRLHEDIFLSIETLYNMPSRLFDTCEQTLLKNKEMIAILEALFSTREETINLKSLLKRFREYSGQNEMLSCSFEDIKTKFIMELKDIVNSVRKVMSERRTLNIQCDKLNRDISELSSQKDDLRKQLQEAENRKCYVNKNKIGELEKQLKEEKSKYSILKDRYSRISCQVKVNADNMSQLEAALEQSRSQCRSLERTVQQLQEQNRKLHDDFEKQFNTFSESIRENTTQLNEIAKAHEKLQAEKEDLEKRLTESENYSESIQNMKKEMNMKVAEAIESERKYEDEKEERLKLVDKVESLCAQLLESDLRYKELCKQLQETEIQLGKYLEYRQEAETMKHQLELANTELNKYHDKFTQQNEAIKEIQNNLQESLIIEENMKCDLKNKEEYAMELEKKVDLLEQRRQDSESKMISYEQQLSSLKQHFIQFQEDFGEFENLNDLRDAVSQQRAKLLETTRKNRELEEALQNKEIELEQHLENITEQENAIQQRDGIIKMLSEKEEEHAKIIKLLRNNIEMRTQADVDLNQRITEKNSEIDTLVANLDTRKQQVSQLEKIILTLEDQTLKASAQRRKDQEKIKYLENKLNEYEIFHIENKRNVEAPAEDLDCIIKILEEELISPIDPKHANKDYVNRIYCGGNKVMQNKTGEYEQVHQEPQTSVDMRSERTPTKVVVGYKNNIEPYSKNIHNEAKFENLIRQRGITNIQTQKGAHYQEINSCKTPPISETPSKVRRKDNYPTNNLHYLTPIQLRDDKKSLKLYKIAGHRL